MSDVATGCKTDDRGMAHLLSIRSIKVNQTSFILHFSKLFAIELIRYKNFQIYQIYILTTVKQKDFSNGQKWRIN